jgi:hypothetical protein
MSVPIKFADLLDAYEWVSAVPLGEWALNNDLQLDPPADIADSR